MQALDRGRGRLRASRAVIRLYAIPYSTNVERVGLALAHKGLDADVVMSDAGDRSPVRELSGQDLVPVIEHDGRVIADSTAILEYLEELQPEPPLYPRDPRAGPRCACSSTGSTGSGSGRRT